MAVPAGAPFSKYIDENVLTPIISRLDFMLNEKHFGTPAEPSHSTSTDEDFIKIKEMMSQVQEQELFDKIRKEEQSLVRRFDQVEKYIDNIFESIAAGRPQTSEVRGRLDTLKKQVVCIRDAILEAHKRQERNDGGEDPVPMKATYRIRAIRDGEGMAHLRRAVSAMEEPLRSCLLSLAAFPEGAVIKKRLLIHWWIGEDLVPDVGKGEIRFKKLVDMNFVQAIHRARSDCDKVHRCTVHPWIHKTIAAVANSTAFMEVDPDDISSNDYQRTRRACLRDGKATLPGSGLQFHPKVSTIYNIDQKYLKLSADCFAKKACLRTLQLGQWRVSEEGKEAADAKKFHVELIHDEHLGGIAACRALRYLSLRGISRIKAIPDAVGNLSELLVLDLRACHNLQVLTKEMTRLKKLQYLDVSECYLLVEMPKGFDKMSELEVLMGFVMASPSRKKACRLSELVNLEKLHKLSICIGKNVMKGREDDASKKVMGENELNTLTALVQLKSLRITWAVMTSKQDDARTPNTEDDMKFSFPPNLVKLELQCFPYKEFRHQIRAEGLSVLKNLQKLYLTGGALNSLEPLYNSNVKVRPRNLSQLKGGELQNISCIME